MKNLSLYEALAEINADTTLLTTKYQYQKHSPLEIIVHYAYMPEYKFKLPDGVPPYKPDINPVGTNPLDLLIAIKRGRLAYFTDDKTIDKIKREQIFIQTLEAINQYEAKVLLAVKDQELTKLFPNLTAQVWHEAGYLPELPKSAEDKPKTKTEAVLESESAEKESVATKRRGRPRKVAKSA